MRVVNALFGTRETGTDEGKSRNGGFMQKTLLPKLIVFCFVVDIVSGAFLDQFWDDFGVDFEESWIHFGRLKDDFAVVG